MLKAVPLVEESSPRRRSLWAIPATLVLLALAALAVTGADRVSSLRDDLLAEARDAGAGREAERELAALLHRESNPARMRLETARTLLNREIARPAPWVTGETRAHLGRVQELAGDAALALPASSRALAVYASALVLLRTRTADTRLFTLFRQWERPLDLAIELDPTDRFPKETLAFVYLEVWPAIAPEKRPEVEELLRTAFETEWTFNGLIGNWIRIAGSLDEAARLVPDRPWAWRRFVDSAAIQKDWPAFLRFEARQRAAIDTETDARLTEAESLAAAGESGRARQLLDETLVQLRPGRAAAGRLERILARRPAGPTGPNTARAAEAWLDWQEPLVLLGRDPLSSEASARLAFLAAGELAPEKAAFASLAAGDLTRAELYERRSQAVWSERWAPYLTLKARRAHERGDDAEARAALEQTHRDFHARLAWSALARETGLRLPVKPSAARKIPGPRDSWEETDWIWSGGRAWLELLPIRAAKALILDLRSAPPEGGALEASWDGAALPPVPLSPGQRRLQLELEVTAEPHLLELRPIGGGVPPTARVTMR